MKMETLTEIWQHIQQQLTRAINDRKHPFRLPVIGTAGGEATNLRIVVLRDFNPASMSLTCYTDARSRKVADLLERDQTMTWLFWNSRQQIQIQAFGIARIEQDTKRTHQLWQKMHLGAKASYLTTKPPGTPASEATNGLPNNLATLEQQNALGSEHFCIIECKIHRLEWLQLDKMQHRRARFEWFELDAKDANTSSNWQMTWLVP